MLCNIAKHKAFLKHCLQSDQKTKLNNPDIDKADRCELYINISVICS